MESFTEQCFNKTENSGDDHRELVLNNTKQQSGGSKIKGQNLPEISFQEKNCFEGDTGDIVRQTNFQSSTYELEMTKGENSSATSRKNEEGVNEGSIFFEKEPTYCGDLIQNGALILEDDLFNDGKLDSLDKALAIKDINKLNNDAQSGNNRVQSLIIG